VGGNGVKRCAVVTNRMNEAITCGQPKSANDLAVERTNLAVERTVMAAGRNLMAWVRTALSMISFGFTIYKFMQAATKGAEVGLLKAEGPRRLGLFLIALGVTIWRPTGPRAVATISPSGN